jgi:hypothetical protein
MSLTDPSLSCRARKYKKLLRGCGRRQAPTEPPYAPSELLDLSVRFGGGTQPDALSLSCGVFRCVRQRPPRRAPPSQGGAPRASRGSRPSGEDVRRPFLAGKAVVCDEHAKRGRLRSSDPAILALRRLRVRGAGDGAAGSGVQAEDERAGWQADVGVPLSGRRASLGTAAGGGFASQGEATQRCTQRSRGCIAATGGWH